MEKGYRDYGHDIDNTDSVLEAGLGFAVDLEEAGRLHRQGRGARAEGRGPADAAAGADAACKDPEPLLFHAEIVRRDGKPVGYVRAASYGHTLGGAVGLAMIERRRADRREVPRERDVGGRDREHALPDPRR